MKGSVTFLGLSLADLAVPQPSTTSAANIAEVGRHSEMSQNEQLTSATTVSEASQQADLSRKGQLTSAAAVADASRQVGLPEKVLSALHQEGVYLPAGVSTEVASSAQYFAVAQQHRMSAGLWVRNFTLRRTLLLFMQQ